MSQTLTTLTSCQYLFNQEANTLYPKLKSDFVNQSLATLMKVVDHLVSTNADSYFLFDPAAFNNQCHIYALIVEKSVQQIRTDRAIQAALKADNAAVITTDYYRPTKRVDARFLYYSFFISFAFINDPKLCVGVVSKAMSELKMAPPTKKQKNFLQDVGNIRIPAARKALNVLFADYIKSATVDNHDPVSTELATLANENLLVPASSGKESLYTFPKFAGVIYFINEIFAQNVALMFKVKVIDKEGTGSFSISNRDITSLEGATPIIVFEMVVAGKSITNLEIRDLAKRCSAYSQRNASSKHRHAEKETCLNCSLKRIDIEPFVNIFNPILTKTDELLKALGADFILQAQKPFAVFFSNAERYPQLTRLFQESVQNIKPFALSMSEPMNMTVSHVYSDNAQRASKPEMVLEDSYENHIKKRGLI